MQLCFTKGRLLMKKETDTKTKNIFAQRLSELIKEYSYTHDIVAQAVGVTRQGVGKWVKGDSLPDILTTAKLAKFFNVSSDYLSGASNAKNRDADAAKAVEYTKLSCEAIDNFVYHYEQAVYNGIYSQKDAEFLSPVYFLVLNELLKDDVVFVVIDKLIKLALDTARAVFGEHKDLESDDLKVHYPHLNFGEKDYQKYTIIKQTEEIIDFCDCEKNNDLYEKIISEPLYQECFSKEYQEEYQEVLNKEKNDNGEFF